jgi:hypothetical protein
MLSVIFEQISYPFKLILTEFHAHFLQTFNKLFEVFDNVYQHFLIQRNVITLNLSVAYRWVNK